MTAILFNAVRVGSYLAYTFAAWRASANMRRHDKYDALADAADAEARKLDGDKSKSPLLQAIRLDSTIKQGAKAVAIADRSEQRWERWHKVATSLSTLREGLSSYEGRKVPYAAGAFDFCVLACVACYFAGIDPEPILKAFGATLARLPMLG